MNTPPGPSNRSTTWTWLALLALTVVSYASSAATPGVGEAEPILFGSSFLKLALIAAVFMELGYGQRRWLLAALAVFAATTLCLLVALPAV